MAAGTPKLISSSADYDASKIGKSRSYLVVNSLMSDGADEAEAAVAALPIPDGFYLAKLHSEAMKEHPLWFKVDVEYLIPPWPGDQSSPLLRPATYSDNYQELMEAYFVDCDDTPKKAINKALERFENFPQRRSNKSFVIMEITKNYSTTDVVAMDLLKHTQNGAAVTIEGTVFDFETLLFLPVRRQKIVEQVGLTKYTYYARTYRLAADHAVFEDKVENRGYKELYTVGSETRQKIL